MHAPSMLHARLTACAASQATLACRGPPHGGPRARCDQFVDEELAVTTGELALVDGLADVEQELIDDALADEDEM